MTLQITLTSSCNIVALKGNIPLKQHTQGFMQLNFATSVFNMGLS